MMEACSCENVPVIYLFIEEVDDTISMLTHVLNTKYSLGETHAISFLLKSLNHNVFNIYDVLKRAIAVPNMYSLETFLKKLDVNEINVDSITDTLMKGNVDLEIVECFLQILDQNYVIVHSVLKKALKYRSLKTLEWVFQKYFEDVSPPEWIFIQACTNGSIYVVRWLSRHYFIFSIHLYMKCILQSSARGHVPLTNWLFGKYSTPLCIEMVIYKTINYKLCKTAIKYVL